MPRLGLGLGLSRIPFISSGAGIDAQAQAHYDRVIADGGAIPAGLLGCSSFFVAVKAVYSTSDITTAISAGYDPHYLGYKLGAGSGTTLGQAAQKLYSCCGASGDVTQATAASQPLLLVHDGATNYFFQSGVNANYCSTPHSTANNISGDIDIIAYIANYKNTGAPLYTIAAKGDTSSYIFDIGSTNYLEFYTGGSSYSSGVSIGSSYTGWVRVTRVASTGVIKFYTSADVQSTNPLSVSWTQSGSDASSPSGSLGTNTNPLTVAGYTTSGLYGLNGSIYRCVISNSIGGSPVVDFNPNSYTASTSQTQWTSTTGEVWTINTGTATTGYKGVLVDRTLIQTDGVDDNIASSATAFTATSVITRYSSLNGLTSANSAYLISSLPSDNTMLFWKPSGTTAQMFNGTGINIIGYSNNSLKLYTSLFNGASSLSLTNNANQNTGSEGTATIRGVMLGNRSGAFNAPANATYNTIIYSLLADNITERTAMYNAIRSFNNNAF